MTSGVGAPSGPYTRVVYRCRKCGRKKTSCSDYRGVASRLRCRVCGAKGFDYAVETVKSGDVRERGHAA